MSEIASGEMAISKTGENASLAKRALFAMRDMQAELQALRGKADMGIAIVGMGCRFPGAPSPGAFWEMLCQKRNGVTEVPAERWDSARLFHPDRSVPGKIASRWGGFLEQADQFDAAFFGISPREAPHVDPRQRKILEIAWEALEDAGIPALSLAGSATGVYIATLSSDYDTLLCQNYGRISASTGTGTANSIIANRLSYLLDLHGPSLTLDTACSGSLLAIELACRSLRAGESSLALAGGVSMNLLPKGDVFFSAAGALSPSGSCKTFDAAADGIVRSEGAGIVILKRLSDAVEDGDRIYAVIRGGAINHDGASNGIMAPSGEAQKRVLREAYKNAGVSPGAVQYVEAHGTGTPLGDPIEVSALAATLEEERDGTPLLLGSLKTNVGHMEAAAGVASVIKVALAMHHRLLPPNRQFHERNPRMPETSFPIEILSEVKEWTPNGKRRVAGVSAFSFGGTNVHLVLEEPPEVSKVSDIKEEREETFVLPISAKSPEALHELREAYREYFNTNSDQLDLRAVCSTAAVRRSHHHVRFAAAASSDREMADLFASVHENRQRVTKLAFVFSGQGSHWKGMAGGLLMTEPVFRATFEQCDLLFKKHAGWSVIAGINSGERLNETDLSQAAVFSMQVALSALWRSWGIQPDAVLGQSLGEVAAAYAAGGLSLEDAAAVVYHRSRLMKTLEGKGKTAVVALSPDAAREAIARWDGDLSVAGNSSRETSVISGTPLAVSAMIASMEQRGIFAQLIAGIDVAFHGPQMKPLRRELEIALNAIGSERTRLAMMSAVTGTWLNGNRPDAEYWGQNLCEPFRLSEALERLIAEGFDGFLEISPRPLLVNEIRHALGHMNAEGEVFESCRRGDTGKRTMLTSLAALYTAGRDVNWPAVFPAGGRLVSLPAYPWQRDRYWFDQLSGGASTSSEEGHPFLGKTTESALPGGHIVWEQRIDLNSPHYLSGHKVLGTTVFPGSGYVEAGLAALREIQNNAGALEISGLRFHEGMALTADSQQRVQIAFSPAATGRYSFQISARPNDVSAWTKYASGEATSVPEIASSSVAREEIRGGNTDLISAGEHYDAMAAQGLEYSGSFRAIRKLWRTKGQAVAELQLDENAATGVEQYCVHPILMDAAFQVVAATIDPSDGHVYSTESYVPQRIDRVRCYTNPGVSAVCKARLKKGQAGDPELSADLQLADAEGRICVEIEGLRLAHVGAGQAGAPGKLRDWLYELCWEEKPRAAVAGSAESGTWTIFADAGGFGEILAEELRARGVSCTVVSCDDDSLDQYAAGAGAGIVYLRGLDNPQNPCLVPLRLVKALAENPAKRRSFWFLTRSTQAVGDSVSTLTEAAQLWGFARVFALEHSEINGGIIDLGESRAEDAKQVADELLSPDTERQLAFRDGKRFAARLRSSPPSQKRRSVVFRPDATYLITGGLGGLGLSLARWMTERGARRFILAGRTGLPPRREWSSLPEEHSAKAKVDAVRELERLGASIHVASFDVGDAEAVRTFLEEFKAEGWPQVRGIVHAAGVVNDQFMLRIEEQSFADVLRPKVAGSLALHHATLDLDLDFFTLFSSVSSVLGQFGQAHYAAGNAFMDHLAHWRRSNGLPATSINWGPWAEVGLFAQLETTDKTGRSGVFPMLPEQALQAMEHLQALAPTQALVVSADWSRMPPSPLLSELTSSSGRGQRSDEEEQAAAGMLLDLLLADPLERTRRLEEYLTAFAASVLRLDSAKLDPKEPLTSFGMDSIMVVELKHNIEKSLNLSLPIVELFTGSIVKLAEQLAGKLATDTQLEELLKQVENMSPQEVEALLGEAKDQ